MRIAFARAHGRSWTDDDHHAVMGATPAAGRSPCAIGYLGEMDLDEIEDAVVSGVVERYRTEPPP